MTDPTNRRRSIRDTLIEIGLQVGKTVCIRSFRTTRNRFHGSVLAARQYRVEYNGVSTVFHALGWTEIATASVNPL
jgi:hypothetical protein